MQTCHEVNLERGPNLFADFMASQHILCFDGLSEKDCQELTDALETIRIFGLFNVIPLCVRIKHTPLRRQLKM